jgi:hypothetical protein
MTIKKSLESRIRGWLPKESRTTQSADDTRKFKFRLKRKPPTLNDRLIGGFGGGGGSLVLMGILFYFLFPIYPRSVILLEELVGAVLLGIAFLFWSRGKKTTGKTSVSEW